MFVDPALLERPFPDEPGPLGGPKGSLSGDLQNRVLAYGQGVSEASVLLEQVCGVSVRTRRGSSGLCAGVLIRGSLD